jgi:carboxyl-terminal processing protease
LLETAVDMLGRFVEDKLVVKMKFRGGQEEVAYTDRGQLHRFNYPVAVLMNEDSASASEIFAGCLKDYGKATLVGTHTYGKASVQNVFPLVDQSSAKITIAKYYLPSTPFFGRKVDEDNVFLTGGLEPHVKIELDLDKDPEPGDPKTDNQLRKAIEVIQQKSR